MIKFLSRKYNRARQSKITQIAKIVAAPARCKRNKVQLCAVSRLFCWP
jgi:hypothetical protein